MRTTRGLLVQDSTGPRFRFLCNEALGIGPNEEAAFSFADPAHPFVATYARGLQAAGADLCQWTDVATGLSPAFDLEVSAPAGKPATYLVLAGDPGAVDRFFASSDLGMSWSALAKSDIIYTRLRVAPSDPRRVYLTGVGLGPDGKTVHRLAVSDDGGVTLTAREIPLERTDLQTLIMGVNPVDKDRIYVRVESTSSERPERLLVSRDAGRTFESVVSLRDIRGLAISSDGATVWVGGREGLRRSSDGGLSFTEATTADLTQVGCLAQYGDRLFACGALGRRLGVGVSDDGGRTFAPVLSFADVNQIVSCRGSATGSSPATVCAEAMDHWLSEVVPPDPIPPPAATPPDAGADAAPASQKRVQTASGCHAAGPGGSGVMALAFAALAGLATRPRRPSLS